ncbi:NADPH-dependent assimilatory sulfite reductase hemoprotein subunit [Alloalcanivorax profundimaris]|uniref:NADPH-dependent assimilatory sulfite reductase hemoprotein subunit n=1 Tax=Alloalcanivorax profundimaris TaxID=2735259 RepID=UPI001887B3B3|nr:NADPH-dependent assimilatory sulfite reductase hemoprotein subunit [Alloalcanivorax profundimaris]MBF1802198.1 NADPH-dependent assimilatory sulfite reductase hemoprotein subunit [Alloalcanivorax profundimaris]MCQ6261040.1 NADPH-dependent assimilatory sulfite reductase hemoprotein subunit [Alcanivorax sp. MM125-6]
MVHRDCDISQPVETLHENEKLKARSHNLRGTIAHGLEDALTGAVPGEDPLLMKFHGIYQQDDRDRRADRRRRHLEPAYQFMVRLRIPGGMLTKRQWSGIDALSRRYAERGIRVTTRQTVQLHGVRKRHLRPLMQGLRKMNLDTIAACGDDSRGVVCGANPFLSSAHRRVAELARATSDRLLPRTGAYPEIWYQETAPKTDNEEPVYGGLYLPRKFKVGYAIPPVNDIDVYGQDLGLIAVVNNGRLLGFNVCVGGGMGQLDSREDSYPRLAEEIGFIEADEAPAFSETVMSIQRDFGDRKDRHRARFKYTLDRLGMDWFLKELASRRGRPLEPARSQRFEHNGDRLGWQRGDDGLWHATLYIESGRVDDALRAQISGLLEQYGGQLRLTTNQNLQLTHLEEHEIQTVHYRLEDLGLAWRLTPDTQAAHTLSCVALPTCGLAMAEAERYTPRLLDLFQRLKGQYGLADLPISLRLTGCPNGCARPYLGEVALTGRAPGLYNLYLGGSFQGGRLARLYAGNVDEARFLELLAPLLKSFARDRNDGEHFGDFLIRWRLLDDQPATPTP